jgi:hypothetical protein
MELFWFFFFCLCYSGESRIGDDGGSWIGDGIRKVVTDTCGKTLEGKEKKRKKKNNDWRQVVLI